MAQSSLLVCPPQLREHQVATELGRDSQFQSSELQAMLPTWVQKMEEMDIAVLMNLLAVNTYFYQKSWLYVSKPGKTYEDNFVCF